MFKRKFARRLLPFIFGNELGQSLAVSFHSIFHRILSTGGGGSQISLIDHLPCILVDKLVVGSQGSSARKLSQWNKGTTYSPT